MASNKAKLTGLRELLLDQTLMVKTGSCTDELLFLQTLKGE